MHTLLRSAALPILLFVLMAGGASIHARAQEIAYVLKDQPEIRGIAISADSQSLAVLFRRETGPPTVTSYEWTLYDLPTGDVRSQTAMNGNSRAGLVASPVNPIVAFQENGEALQDDRVAIWNLENDEMAYLDSPEFKVDSLCLPAFSCDGKFLASAASHAKSVIVWDVASRKPVHVLRTPGNPGNVAFVPDGSRLAVGGQLRTPGKEAPSARAKR